MPVVGLVGVVCAGGRGPGGPVVAGCGRTVILARGAVGLVRACDCTRQRQDEAARKEQEQEQDAGLNGADRGNG